jgi:hypothetical protein
LAGSLFDARLGSLAPPRDDSGYAQLQRHGHRADCDHLQYRRSVTIDRARLQPALREGHFTITNANLVHDLKERGLWDEVMASDLKYYEGMVSAIDRVPDDLKALYATAFEIAPEWLIRAAARRQNGSTSRSH